MASASLSLARTCSCSLQIGVVGQQRTSEGRLQCFGPSIRRGRGAQRSLQLAATRQPKVESKPASPSTPAVVEDDSYRGKLPGDDVDFFEGPQWNFFGVLVEYLWGVGILIAVIACIIAVRSYNEGAVDYKQTAEYLTALEAEEAAGLGASFLEDAPPLN